MAKGRSGRSGRSGGHRSHGARKTGIGHRTHHHTSSRSAFSRRNHRTTANHHTTTSRGGVLRVSGGSSRNNPQTLLILGGIFCLLAIGELIACLVLGVMVATCVKQPKQNNCPEYDSVLIPLGSTGGIFLVMGVFFIILSIRMIIQRKRAASAAAVAELGLANVSVMQLETGEPVAQQHPMMISNAVGYYGQPYVPNAVMMNYQYPPNNSTVILPNQQQPIYYYNNQTNSVVNTDQQLGILQNYNLSGMPVNMDNFNPNISNVKQQDDAIPYSSTNYANPTSDHEAIYIPSPQIPPPTQQQQQIYLDHDNKV